MTGRKNNISTLEPDVTFEGAITRASQQTYQLTVLAPCFNEAKNIPELVARLMRVFEKKAIVGEMILVDDASTDNTLEVMRALVDSYSSLSLVIHKKNRGIAGAWCSGLRAARGEYVCLIDADLQNLPEDVWRLYREITLSNADLVQGYRSSVGRLRDSRYFLSKGLNSLLNGLFAMRLRDNKSGFVIAACEVLRDILAFENKYFFPNTFIAVAAQSKGYSIREVETLFQDRMLGTSYLARFPIRAVLQCLVDLMPAFFEFRLSSRRDSALREYLRANPPSHASEPLRGWRKVTMDLFFLTMPLHKWMITTNARKHYEELNQSQWLSPGQVREYQEERLRALVRHAYQHVPFYRQRFDAAGVRPHDIQSLGDLCKLPLLSKQDVRDNLYFDLMADNHVKSEILRVQTSGSTGEPFVCFADRNQLEIRWAATQRGLEWTGYRFGDKQARLWHQTIGMSRLQVFREKIDALFLRRIFIPAFELSDQNLDAFIRKIVRHQPFLVDGYAESLNFLAQYVQERGIPGFQPKAIISSAQSLPEQSRAIIENAFKCRVFDKYGSREFSGIAYECEAHDGHHVVAESYIVEVLKDGRPAKPGELGEVIITDLSNRCLPFIRYRIGDVAVAADNTVPCSCGRGLPKIGRIEGRVQAIIRGTNGNYLPGAFFAHFFKDYDFLIRQYQVVQEELGSVTLRLIKAPAFNHDSFQEVLRGLRQFLGADMKIDVQLVDSIPMVRTGKRQLSLSTVPLDFQMITTELTEGPMLPPQEESQ